MKPETRRTILELCGGFIKELGRVTWCSWKALFNHGVYWKLKESDHNELRRVLAKGYYIILTAGHPALSNPAVKIATYFKSGYWPNFTHALLNADIEEDPLQSQNFKFIEAIETGVVYSSFMRVFDCDVVALLQPKGFTEDEWEKALMRAKDNLGKEYDTLFDLMDDKELSCVELVRDALIHSFNTYSEYKKRFPNFEAMIERNGWDLTPEMYFRCKDFDLKMFIDRRDE